MAPVVPTAEVIDLLLDVRRHGSVPFVAGVDGLLSRVSRRPELPLAEVQRMLVELEALEARDRRRNPSGRLRRWTYAASASDVSDRP